MTAPSPVVPVMFPPFTRLERLPPSTPPSEEEAPVPLELSASNATLSASTISWSSRSSSLSSSSLSFCPGLEFPPPPMAAAEHSRSAVTAYDMSLAERSDL
eukprot:CAMPEP_0184449798 /NCGR_PEP_ID=MMETSP0740-20130409/5332_1 /TAXON_ID=385413 /ORGANISM="Thalassiosira miniscula, Strain CCMP1093" /LENGTH=100 /DNA_ID=CAMNT_0026819969 /DNA_START=89 /DNA_END=391 /DNA_ORIENTATION=-